MDLTKLFMGLSACGMCPRRSSSKKMEASFCHAVSVRNAGTAPVRATLVPGGAVKVRIRNGDT